MSTSCPLAFTHQVQPPTPQGSVGEMGAESPGSSASLPAATPRHEGPGAQQAPKARQSDRHPCQAGGHCSAWTEQQEQSGEAKPVSPMGCTGVAVHAWNPAPWDPEAGGQGQEACLGN